MGTRSRQLVIETATAACSVALIESGVVIAACHEIVGRGHAERLVPMIAGLPDGGRAESIHVDCGPGSFTGIRVGLAAARALALGWNVPVTGFSSLSLIAADIDDVPTELTITIGGGHGELFFQRFSTAPLTPVGVMTSLKPEAAAQATDDTVIAGAGADMLVQARGWGETRPGEANAANFVRLPATLTDLPPTPLYGRAPDARPAGQPR